MNYLDIDFDNKNHNSYIKKLAKRNDFYPKQIHCLVDGFYKDKQGQLHIGRNATDRFDNGYTGKFLIENKKVIGFIIYQKLYGLYFKVDFMMVDKDYRHKGYAKILFNLVRLDFDQSSAKFIVVECEENSKEFYIRNFDFFELRKDNLKDPMLATEDEQLCHFHYVRHSVSNFRYVYKIK
jgi:ribosomal protein S18 acetylase RimI-like enzyme